MLAQPIGPCPSSLMIISEGPMATWEIEKLLLEAGLTGAFITYVCRERPPGNDISKWIAKSKKEAKEWMASGEGFALQDKVVKKPILEGYDLLQKEIALCQPKVIVPLGNLALWSIIQKWGILEQRGSLYKAHGAWIMPALHPAAALRQFSFRPLIVKDLTKAARLLKGEVPEEPEFKWEIAPSLAVVIGRLQWLLERARKGPVELVLDLETSIQTHHIRCCGLAWSPVDAIVIPFTTGSGATTKPYWMEEEEALVIWCLYQLLTHPNIILIGQNLLFDTQMIYRHWGFIPTKWWDCMLAAHTCFSTMPKSLDFLASIHGGLNYQQWKGTEHHDSGKEND